MDVRDEVASERIRKDQRTTDQFSSKDEALSATKKRNADDRARFLSLYEVDLWDDRNYDLKLDTSDLSAEQVCSRIIARFSEIVAVK